MRLKKLILHGFKSFADRTEFVFDSPITGIVGPNGCGKSNVVDAFKWVLGEQSAKSLRGEAMLDVIFNGSQQRKPGGMAEVVLVFENPRREDGTRLLNIDAEEVSVGRRLFRDATSEYMLNNKSARLKDIRELFLDTGIGVDAYSVIEQGRVAALLEANPLERRLIFEEAAGISKYKVKKREAQRKLEKVEQNLLRVTDIIEEVEKRLRSVKVQAGRARTYQEYSTRLRELRLQYALQEFHTHQLQLVKLNDQQQDAQFRLDDAAADLARRQNELAERREQAEALARRRQSAEYELVQTRAARQSSQQKQKYAAEQIRQLGEQRAAFEQDASAAHAKLASVSEALERESQTLSRLTEELEAHRTQIEQRQQAFRDGQLKLNEVNRQIEQHKSAILDVMRRQAQVNSRLGAIEIEQKNIAAQQSRLGERRRVVVGEIESLEQQRGGLQQKLQDVTAQIASLQQQMEARRQDAAQLGRQIAQISEQLGAAREHRSGLVSRQKLLKDLEAKREGVSEGVKAVLRQREHGQAFAFIRGLVADVLRVDVEHAYAIEAALDGRDQWLVTDDSAAALAAQEAFAELEGRVNVLCADHLARRSGADDSAVDWNQYGVGVRLAVDLIRVEPADRHIAEHLLGRTAVVDDLEAARRLHQYGPAGWRYATLDGAVLEADGTLRLGPLTESMGLLSRHAELEAIAQQIAEVDRRIEQFTEQLTSGNRQARELEQQVNTLRNEIYQLNTQKVELTSALAQNQDKLNALRREQPVLDNELRGLLDQSGRLTAESEQLATKRQELEQAQASHQQQADELAQRQQETAERLKQWGEELTACRVEMGQIQEKQLACQQQVQRYAASRSELTEQIQRLERSIESVASRRQQVEKELESARADEQRLVEAEQRLGEQVQALAGELQQTQQAVSELSAGVEQMRQQHAQIEQELHQLQLQLSELNVRLETLVKRTLEELELDLPQRYAELSAQEGGYSPADLDWDAVAEEIRQLREKIQRLGNVNLDAIGEQDELEQRWKFLSEQMTDLTTSKTQLESLIEEINTESSRRFLETFNSVREHFQGMFRKLFGGGKADIFLETEIEVRARDGEVDENGNPVKTIRKKVDVLDAGIEIIARPPGKQPVSISQLSGGEKTMTCVALLMSIFKSKPSPFCILDEVDAALDEANNQRFNMIVQEFLQQSQFIIITHSKRTMQIADMLYGVTMQEQGVSKRVAVKFEQVGARGEIKEEHAAA